MPKRMRRLVPTIAIAAGLLAAACDYDVQAEQLVVVDAQEESIWSDGDEPYLAVVQYRSTPGQAGSTEVEYLGNLAELSDGADDGAVLDVPPAMGRALFRDVDTLSQDDIVATGELPEIVGTIVVAMESDASPWSAIDGIMEDVEAELDTQLQTIVEPLTLTNLLNPSSIAADLANAANAVQAAATPSIGEAIGIWFASFGDPDDLIGFGFTAFVAVEGSLADSVDAALGSALPANAIGGALRGNNPFTMRFSGDGATYDVNFSVAKF